jgi:hypothetical protein
MLFAILFFITLFLRPFPISAIYDPMSVPNNRYGVHIADTNDLEEATKLINSTGGAWGYITVVIPDNDMDRGKWQEIFNRMRRKQIIPLVRIATHVEGNSWVKPQEHNIQKWVDFLDSLSWPIENRYVIIFNEPNHAKEWGNTIDPEGYASILDKFSSALKAKSNDFFILPAGLDASATTDGITLDEETYLRRMLVSQPNLWQTIDGWTSHSYPNPGFSGTPYATGKGTLATFLWEQELFKTLGNNRKLPIFITETGWQHASGKYYDPRLLSPETVSSYISTASLSIWQNTNIVAITPFLFNYQDYPFDHFSFKKFNDSGYYSHYFAYQQIPKVMGKPQQRESIQMSLQFIPQSMVMQSTYLLEGAITNTGQSIIDPLNDYALRIRDNKNMFTSICDPVPKLEPYENGTIRCTVQSPNQEGVYVVYASVLHGSKEIPVEQTMVRIIPPPSAGLHVTLGFNSTVSIPSATVLVYDIDETLIHKFTNVPIQQGVMSITGLYQVIPGKKYRIVVLVPYYLPRQEIITMNEQKNNWTIRRLYPFDFNKDGTFTTVDILSMFLLSPKKVLDLIF